VNEELVRRHGGALFDALGPAGRLIADSKTRYTQANPSHAAIFNANICLRGGKVWWGDIDLTVDEPALHAVAARIGEVVYVLYEDDARFDAEDRPLLERGAFSVSPTGHTRFEHQRFERAADGTLRQRSIPRPPRLRRPGRPGLWRFWRIELRTERGRRVPPSRSTFLRIGGRHPDHPVARSALLVLALHRHSTPTVWRALEIAWYPAAGRSWAPPLRLRLGRRHGRTLYLALWAHPGSIYQIQVGVERLPFGG
jgi:hypothetical protein